jgi:hypothetical protein
MSGFMFGGSALTLDIGVKNTTGLSLERGDVVQVAVLNADSADGFNAVIPDVAATSLGQYAPAGVVQAPPGLSIPNNEDMIVRIVGVTDVSLNVAAGTLYTRDQISNVTTAGAAGAQCTIAASAAVLTTAGVAGLQQKARAHAVILGTTVTTGGVATTRERISCWFNGLP